MTPEEKVIEELEEKIEFLKGKLTSPCEKRIFSAPLDRNQFNRVIRFLHDKTTFFRAHHVIGVDDGDELGFIYLLSNSDNIMLALKEKAPKSNPEIDSATWLYPAFLLHELELCDLFGAVIDGLPDRPHYPLPDNWPKGQYPMRKEWKPEYFNKDTMTYENPEDNGEGEKK